MKHYYGLAYRYLKQHKKRSVLTIVGIILSMALVFSATSMGEALKDDLINRVKLEKGNFHVLYTGLGENQILQLRDNAKVELTAAWRDVGYHTIRTGLSVHVVGGTGEMLDVHNLKLDEGRLPEKDGELVLERWVLASMEGKPKLGDKLRLKLTEEDQREMNPAAPAPSATVREAEFTLTGILKNKIATQQTGSGYGMTSLEYAKSLRGDSADGSVVAVRFKKGLKLRDAIKDTSAAIGAGADRTFPNEPLLTALGEGGKKQNNTALLIAQCIVAGIILVATVAVIYNAFHISVLERIRQFGILRSVGMTPRQIRKLVFREAGMLAGIGIPLGIVAGWGTIKLLIAVFRWMDGGKFVGSLQITFHWYVPVGTALMGLVAVYASALGPALTAGRVSPLDAVLNRNSFNKEKALRRKRRPRWLTLPLGLAGRMALDNLKRNRKRYRITLFSMSIGIVLYVFFSSFMFFIQGGDDVNFSKDMALDRFTRETKEFTPAVYDDIAALPGVKNVYRIMDDNRSVQVKTERLTKEYLNMPKPSADYVWLGTEVMGLRAAELDILKPRLFKGRINPEDMDAENGVVVVQKMRGNEKVIEATDLHIGDLITVGRYENGNGFTEPVQVKVMGIAEANPFSFMATPHYSIVTTEKVFSAITGKSGFARFLIELEGDADPGAVKDRLQQIADGTEGRVLDYTNNDAKMALMQISILLYGLVAVISLISAINIIHTTSTNLILRTREFGTLRAVGMTMKQMRRMIVFESIWYGIMATVYGGTVGTLLAYWFYTNVNSVQDIPYRFPLAELLSSGAASALICLLASRVPLKRIERMDIVRAVRAEE